MITTKISFTLHAVIISMIMAMATALPCTPASHNDTQFIPDSSLYRELDTMDSETLVRDEARFNTEFLLALVYNREGRADDAGDVYRKSLDYATRNGYLMYEANLSNALSFHHRQIGNNDSANMYYGKFLILKDSLERNHGMSGVEKLSFMSQIDDINAKVEQLSLKLQEDRRMRIIIIAVLIVVVVILVALLWVHLNLKRNHRNLFQRNKEMQRLSSQHRLLREEWEKERKELTAKIEEYRNSQENTADGNPSIKKTYTLPENGDTLSGEDDRETSEVSDMEELKRIYTRVLAVMEESKAIFEPGFSMHELQKLTKSSAKSVSKAINVCHHANFHMLLNEYRIREVTRIMHTPEAANLTVEAIAESVGFKSRTSFSTLFKKITGLTPTEYIRMARSKTSDNKPSPQ